MLKVDIFIDIVFLLVQTKRKVQVNMVKVDVLIERLLSVQAQVTVDVNVFINWQRS